MAKRHIRKLGSVCLGWGWLGGYAYAIMSNHYHLVLHVNKSGAESWSDAEIIRRWLSIYKGPELIHRYQRQIPMTEAELLQVQATITTWRSRLCSISWFMRLLNEHIAR